jgi:hypothetical protein
LKSISPQTGSLAKGDDKCYTTAITSTVQVDRQHLQKACKLMIEIFETEQDILLNDILMQIGDNEKERSACHMAFH